MDHLPTISAEEADPERSVPNPALKDKRRELDQVEARLAKAEQDYDQKAHDNPERDRPERARVLRTTDGTSGALQWGLGPVSSTVHQCRGLPGGSRERWSGLFRFFRERSGSMGDARADGRPVFGFGLPMVLVIGGRVRTKGR